MARSIRRAHPAVLAVAVLVACVLAGVSLDAEGRAGRVHGAARRPGGDGTPIRVVRTSRELYETLKRDGGRGRVVVSASRYLHFEEPDGDPAWAAQDAFPLHVDDVVRFYEGRVGVTNYLWVALRAGVAREIVHVVPPPVLVAKKDAARADPIDVVSLDEALTVHHWGSRRTITAAAPRRAEPVVLEVDASYFEVGDPAELARRVEDSQLTADLVTLCLAEDNPDVSRRGRDGLVAFAALLRSGGARGR